MSNLKQKAKGFLIGASMVPAMGILHHCMGYITDEWYDLENYSLKNRFECAYFTNVPESHRNFTATARNHVRNEKYPVGPNFTYPAMLFAGLAGLMLADEKRRRKCQNVINSLDKLMDKKFGRC